MIKPYRPVGLQVNHALPAQVNPALLRWDCSDGTVQMGLFRWHSYGTVQVAFFFIESFMHHAETI
jgi:hypothetical protein